LIKNQDVGEKTMSTLADAIAAMHEVSDTLMAGTYWVGVDFDGTLVKSAKYPAIGKPIPRMVNEIRKWIKNGVRVDNHPDLIHTIRLFTARAGDAKQRKILGAWCRQHLGKELEVTNVKDSGLVRIVDNISIHVDENTGKIHDDYHAGGPGSGWTTEGGHVKHTGVTSKGLMEHFQGFSRNPLSKTMKKVTNALEKAKLDSRYFDSRHLTKVRGADSLAYIHPLAVANYNEKHRKLEFRNDASKDDIIHELAHHLDIAFVRSPDKQDGDKHEINKAVAQKVQADYTSEWQAAKDKLSGELGHRFNFTNDNAKIPSSSAKGLPTLYSADSPKEWFAESFYLYVKGGQYRTHLENVAPKTAAAVKTVISGRIFK
jgi:hypothetical protein